MMFAPLFLAAALVIPLPPDSTRGLIEYHMHMEPSDGGKRVALTFDACTGKVDERILKALVDNNIKATIFVTARWLKRNLAAIATLKTHSNLFEIENHGAKHLPAVDVPMNVFNLVAAGSPEAVKAEIEGGDTAVKSAFGTTPHWYRGAAAEYTKSSLELIHTLNFRPAGFSLSGDGGASWSMSRAAKAVAGARDGDVIIAHINQPTNPAGAGVVEGMLKLKAEGFSFVTLDMGFATRLLPSGERH